jgi:hypothetical protein
LQILDCSHNEIDELLLEGLNELTILDADLNIYSKDVTNENTKVENFDFPPLPELRMLSLRETVLSSSGHDNISLENLEQFTLCLRSPKLFYLDTFGSNINKVVAGNNTNLEIASVKNCNNIEDLNLVENDNLKKIKGIQDLIKINTIDLTKTNKVRLIHTDKLDGYIEIKEAVKQIFGVEDGKLSEKIENLRGPDGKIDKDKLTDAIKSKVIIDNSDIKLLNDKKDVENTLLKSGDKYQEWLKLLSKIEALEELGFKLSDDEKELINKADSIEKVEEVRNEIIKGKFGKLLSQNRNYLAITIVLALNCL